MKFLPAIIEKFSILLKNFYYPRSTCRNFLTFPHTRNPALALTSPNFFRLGGFGGNGELLYMSIYCWRHALRPPPTFFGGGGLEATLLLYMSICYWRLALRASPNFFRGGWIQRCLFNTIGLPSDPPPTFSVRGGGSAILSSKWLPVRTW